MPVAQPTRLALSALLLFGAVLAVRFAVLPLSCLAIAGLAARCAGRSLRAVAWSLWPVLVFCTSVLVLQALNGSVDVVLPVRTVAILLLSTAAVRVFPWEWAAGRLTPRSRFYELGLFLLFIRHFSEILVAESRRTFQARALCVQGSFRRGGFSSLRWALTGLLRRVLVRAERFYAAQSWNEISR